jgi:vancomycin resistance protein VanW
MMRPIECWRLAKRQVRLLQRAWQDTASGHQRLFARAAPHDLPPTERALSQPIQHSTTVANKRVNIRLACAAIEPVLIHPSAIFSFWKAVGPPSSRRGYQASRNIRAGELREEVGGGLCQVSGILYHLALLSGFDIMERHPHSMDIYRESERYTPLGADATVVYGYKDLWLRNPFSYPIAFGFEVSDDQLTCRICAEQTPTLQEIHFERNALDTTEHVRTLRRVGEDWVLLTESVYKKT